MDRNYKDFLTDVADKKRFSNETEYAYFTIIRDKATPKNVKDEAKKRIAANHVPFVISVAKKFSSRNSSRCDLVNVGMTGLMRAIDSFDPDSGNRFISYAVWWIRQAIYKHVFNDDDLIHVPQNEKVRLRKLTKDRDFSDVDLEDIGLTKKEIENLMSASSAQSVKSLDSPVARSNYSDSSDLTYADVIKGPDLYCQKEEEEFNRNVRSLLDLVSSEKDKDIITKSFGLDGHVHSFHEIGEYYGRSGERMRQYRTRAIRRLAASARKSNMFREMAGLPRLSSADSYESAARYGSTEAESN